MKTNSYITWAKAHHEVRYNLASSGVAPPSLETLGVALDDFSLTGEDEEGWAPLIERIARRYEVRSSQVALAQGMSMANHMVCALFLKPGDHVLLEHPCYEPLHLVPRFFHADVDFFERPRDDQFRLSSALIEEKLTDHTRLVILSNLHNPTRPVLECRRARADRATGGRKGFSRRDRRGLPGMALRPG